ncbi:MAG: DMT family transporter [Saprospiraceae bacterium]|nr:DMT family transporter [Saprospiraceae bacterium]
MVALIYGANYSIAKIVLDPGIIGANGFILLRIVVATVLFVLFFGLPKRVNKSDHLELIICSITGVLANQLLFFNGLALTSPIHAALIMVCTPLLVLILSTIEGKILSRINWLGCGIGFVGAIGLIMSGNPKDSRGGNWVGDLLVLANAISYAFYLTRIPKLLNKYSAFDIMKWIFLIACFMCLPFGFKEIGRVNWAGFTNTEWYSLGFVLVCTTFLAYTFNAKALVLSDSSLVSNYIYLQPLIAVIFALIMKKGDLSANITISGLLIIAGVFLSGRRD